MPRRRGSEAALKHAELMRALRAPRGLPFEGELEARESAKKRRGRPPGAKNWAGDQVAKYLEAQGYMDPILGWADIQSRTMDAVAALFQCSLKDAFAIWNECAKNVAAHSRMKMPQAVNLDTGAAVQLNIIGFAGEALPMAPSSGAITIEGTALPSPDPEKKP